MKKIRRGGITYGKSHNEGGIPVKNASTGQMLEVEGGEGIVNKRSMASNKMVTVNGKSMTICEAVSQLNEMEGGVQFDCDDVEHKQFIEEMALGGELERGKRTEKEHIETLRKLYEKRITPSQATTQVAKEHLKEDPKYYSKLAKMERKMVKGGKIKSAEKFKKADKVVGNFRYEYGEGEVSVPLLESGNQVYGEIIEVKELGGTTIFVVKFENGIILQIPDFTINNYVMKRSYADGGMADKLDMYVNMSSTKMEEYETVTNLNTLKSLEKNGFIELNPNTGGTKTITKEEIVPRSKPSYKESGIWNQTYSNSYKIRFDDIKSAESPKFTFKGTEYFVGYKKGSNFLKFYVLKKGKAWDKYNSETKMKQGGQTKNNPFESFGLLKDFDQDVFKKLDTMLEIDADLCNVEKSVCKDTFNIDRSKMPQVYEEIIPEYVDFLDMQGIRSKMEYDVEVGTLKPTQKNISLERIKRSLKRLLEGYYTDESGKKLNPLKRKLIVSKDNYILDGHHRWAASYILSPKNTVDVLRIDTNISDLVPVSQNFSMATFQKFLLGGKIDENREQKLFTTAIPKFPKGGITILVNPDFPKNSCYSEVGKRAIITSSKIWAWEYRQFLQDQITPQLTDFKVGTSNIPIDFVYGSPQSGNVFYQDVFETTGKLYWDRNDRPRLTLWFYEGKSNVTVKVFLNDILIRNGLDNSNLYDIIEQIFVNIIRPSDFVKSSDIKSTGIVKRKSKKTAAASTIAQSVQQPTTASSTNVTSDKYGKQLKVGDFVYNQLNGLTYESIFEIVEIEDSNPSVPLCRLVFVDNNYDYKEFVKDTNLILTDDPFNYKIGELVKINDLKYNLCGGTFISGVSIAEIGKRHEKRTGNTNFDILCGSQAEPFKNDTWKIIDRLGKRNSKGQTYKFYVIEVITTMAVGVKTAIFLELGLSKAQPQVQKPIQTVRQQITENNKQIRAIQDLMLNFTEDEISVRKYLSGEIKKLQLENSREINNSLYADNTLVNLLSYYAVKVSESQRPIDIVAKSGLETPSGEPSELSVEQHALVRTDVFKQWFGDWELAYETKNYNGVSKCINPRTGEPLVMYHGKTNQKVEATYFNLKKFPMKYFAQNLSYSQWFANQGKGVSVVYEFFIKVLNPIDFSKIGLDEITPEVFKTLISALYGYQIKTQLIAPNKPMKAWHILRGNPTMLAEIRDNTNFDGFIIYENNPQDLIEGKENTTLDFTTFENSQAKAADGRNQTFLPDVQDVRFEQGGHLLN